MEKRNFKIKDRVRILSNDCGSRNEIGDIGIITEISYVSAIKVTVEGRPTSANWSHRDELELVVGEIVTFEEFRHFLDHEIDFPTYDGLVDSRGILCFDNLFKVLNSKYNLTLK